jgi:gliding motility-associated-like protein
MLQRFARFVLVLIGLHAGATAHATHMVGGEIVYQCLGNDSFLITLNVFRDCYNGVPPFDNPASIGVFDENWNYITQYLLPYTKDDTLGVTLNDPCLQFPPDVCVHRTSYTKRAKLPFRPGGYNLVYQRCCRNVLIRNIIDPEATGASFVAHITEASLQLCNSSPVFRQWPPVAICVDQPILFDHGANDPDGDSLVYKLCAPNSGANPDQPIPQPPFAGPYDPVMWTNAPYNLDNVLGGIPLQIDPKTGFLTGTPDELGNYVVGVCVEEYRNGVLISSTNRDFQYNVADCGLPAATFFSPQVVCDAGVKFTNFSGQGANYVWYFDWPNTNLTSTDYSPTFSFPDTGSFTVALIVNPDQPCRDTAFRTVQVRKSTVSAQFDVMQGICDTAGQQFSVLNLANDPVHGIQSVQWQLSGPTGNIDLPVWNPMLTLTQPGLYFLSLNATSLNGCSITYRDTLEVLIPELTGLNTLVRVCLGDTVRLFPNAVPDFSYTWTPALYLSSDTVANPLCTPLASQNYQLLATHLISGCPADGAVQVLVSQPNNGLVSAVPPSIFQGETSQLNYDLANVASLVWSPAATLSNALINDPVAKPTEDSTYYTVIAQLTNGCADTQRVLVVTRAPICDEPIVFFPTAFSPNGDDENDDLGIESNLIQEVYWVIYDRWGEQVFEATSKKQRWDGSFQGKALPPDTYGYYLRVLCVGGGRLERKGNVTLLR